jgi:hypothetical protein
MLQVRTGAPFRRKNTRDGATPHVAILSWGVKLCWRLPLLCLLEDETSHDAKNTHDDQEGDRETAVAFAALFA